MEIMKIERISTGAKWEDIVGYSRAIKYGNTVEISGTIALDETGRIVGIGNPYLQTKRIIEIAKNALHDLGGGLENVTRTRIYTTNIADWEEIGLAHGEFFGNIKPATTMIEISKLILPETTVEMEFTAILNS